MKIYILPILVLATFFPGFVFGQIIISEVMYDLSGTDTDREWVEIQNSGTESITITTGSGNGSWRFSDTSPHTLTIFSGETTLIAGQYAVIAKNSTQFLIDYPSFSGTLFTSAISLPNTTATLSVKDGTGNILDTYVYNSEMGAKGDGNSLQKVSGSFSVGLPTPGAVNSTGQVVAENTDGQSNTNSPVSESTGTSSGSVSSAHSSPAPINKSTTKIDFEIYAGRDRLTTVGNSLVFKADSVKSQGITEQSIGYSWSFGDGSIGNNKTTEHSYRFSGEYNVILNASYADKQAVSRLVVKVVQPDLAIKKVFGGVEVHNKTKQEINLNGWTLSSNFRLFKFPVDTLIGPDKKVVFPDNTTGMSIGNVALLNPYGEIFSSFKETIEQVSPTKSPEMVLEMEKEVLVLQSQIKNILETNIQNKPKPIAVLPKIVPPKEIVPISLSVVEDKEIETRDTNLIFEAEKKEGFVNKMFALPIKGLDFILSIFD